MLPEVPNEAFDAFVRGVWEAPATAPPGCESNERARDRGLGVVRGILSEWGGDEVAVATHGNLLALILNGLDSTFGYDFWRQLSFPDIYALSFDGTVLADVDRLWRPGSTDRGQHGMLPTAIAGLNGEPHVRTAPQRYRRDRTR